MPKTKNKGVATGMGTYGFFNAEEKTVKIDIFLVF